MAEISAKCCQRRLGSRPDVTFAVFDGAVIFFPSSSGEPGHGFFGAHASRNATRTVES
jgi:hypothetical protein